MEAIAEQGSTLLDSISDFCRHNGIAESTFGRRAVNDGKFVSRLRDGARITPETLDRVTTFLERHGASAPASPPELRRLIRVAGRHDLLRAVFRYDMHTLPTEIAESIGTSTLFAAWNAAVYVAQIDDERLAQVMGQRKYLDATRDVLQAHGGLWFLDESYVVSRKRG